MKTIFTVPSTAARMLSVSSAKFLLGEQRYAHDAGVLDTGVQSIHVERRRTDENPVAARVAEAADQHVDCFAAAARDEYLSLLDAVVVGELRLQDRRPWRRIDVQPALGVVAGRAPRRFVGVQADAAGLVRAGHVRPDAAQLRARKIEHRAHARSPQTASRSFTAHACASRPSRPASVVAIGPIARKPSMLSSCTVIEREEIRDAEARVTAREPVCGQHVVRAAAVVADGLGRPRPEEHGARRLDLIQPSARLRDLQDQVLRRIAVRHRERGIEIVDDEHARVRERAFDELAAREPCLLYVDRCDDGARELGARRHEQHLRVRAMLGLRQQVGGDERCVGVGVGDDEHLGRPGRIVARGTGRIAIHLRFRFRDPGVAGAEDLVDLRHALGAVRHRGDRLRAAELEHALHAGDSRRVQHGGVDTPRALARDCRGSASRSPRCARERRA